MKVDTPDKRVAIRQIYKRTAELRNGFWAWEEDYGVIDYSVTRKSWRLLARDKSEFVLADTTGYKIPELTALWRVTDIGENDKLRTGDEITLYLDCTDTPHPSYSPTTVLKLSLHPPCQ